MKIKICNVHKMALANEGGERKPIHIPFGTWDYDDTITQTLDRPHAESIANELAAQIADGEPGIPVYQGHPDVPEYAGKYPDKGALGWVKKIMVNGDGMDLFVDWDRDPGKGFGWFSPYWVGDRPTVGSGGKKNVIVDGLNSIGLVNNPNIREFRLANEAHFEERKPMDPYQLPQHIIDLANEWDESKHPRDDDGKFAPAGTATGIYSVDNWNKQFAEHRSNRSFWRKTEGPNEVLERLRHHTASYRSRAAELRKSGSRGDKYMNGKFEADYLAQDRINNRESIVRVHKAAILAGYTYNPKTRRYE